MIEQEAIKELHSIRPRGGIIPQKRAEAIDVAIKALEEIRQYREIGTPEKIKEELDRLRNDKECQGLYFTLEERQDLARQHKELEKYRAIGKVDECRAAVEKQNAREPHPYIAFDGIERSGCPRCFEERGKNEILYAGQKYCSVCGQRLERKND